MSIDLHEIESALAGALPGGLDERIETHAAVVLLGGDRAFKLKKPVAFSFLDFTTLAAREAALRNELALNRRTAPHIYRCVRPVTMTGDRLGLPGEGEGDGEGVIVEWVLEMRRFPQSCRFDRVAARHGLEPASMLALGREVARFHGTLAPLTEAGGAAAHEEIARGNALDLRRSVPEVLDEATVELLIRRLDAELSSRTPLLEKRRREGFVRHCHGDLHLENIALLDDRPVLFDCIEFDDAFARIDLLYDIAFLVMDLLDRGFADAAWQVLHGYLEASADEDANDAGLALLPLFLATRAVIRGKIEAFGARRARARGYLALAADCLADEAPSMIAVGGLSGTGKSTLAMRLAPMVGARPGAVLLRSDVLRKRLIGLEPTERAPARAYDETVSEAMFARMAERALRLLEAGRSVVVDSVFARPGQRRAMRAVADRAGAPFEGIWLHAPQTVLEARVAARRNDASDADVTIVRQQATYDPGAIDWHQQDASRGVEDTLRALEPVLAPLRRSSPAAPPSSDDG